MRQDSISAYELACGRVQRESINGCWIELYKESGCYHVRMGRNGEKWSRWETFDNTFESPLYQARVAWSYFKLLSRHGLIYPTKCDQCSPSTINGIFCHEHGCPNENKFFDNHEGEWMEREISDELEFDE